MQFNLHGEMQLEVHVHMHFDERDLRNAVDLADLERRQRCRQRGRSEALVYLHLVG